jgi:molybdopterin-guanine dinucleotide biosynthesis protein A
MTEEIDLTTITLAIVAGGMGRRMGFPKAWLRIGDKSILAWLHAKLQWPGPTMLVSSPSTANPPDVNLFDQTLVDPVDDLGPLRGVLTALEHLTTSTVVIIPIDMPAINAHQLKWLAKQLALRPNNCAGIMCETKQNAQHRTEPFPSAFRREAVEPIAQCLREGRRSIGGLCDDSKFCVIAAPMEWPDNIWTNLNDPNQFAAFAANGNEHRSSD